MVRALAPQRHENVRFESFSCLQRSHPVARVTIGKIRKLLEVEYLAEVGNPICGNENDGVASRVSSAQIENLNLLTTEMERYTIAIGLIRKARLPLFRRRILKQPGEIGPIVFMTRGATSVKPLFEFA